MPHPPGFWRDRAASGWPQTREVSPLLRAAPTSLHAGTWWFVHSLAGGCARTAVD
ncbi:hypothetical protein I553_7383 [Mycobacterium xenopi 4042]|uniref:Uncharacterized protein n=1 Tax=Mycobacterium xenopi 4042 TaxID=1299334 RepID=X8E868_MYCXE|nr:hypothetical protein I552_4978 [Mycobacterium xenopi 3993]EUA76386.1 hypothetical protein I553_7383 [Mycobacterium xenopi 4042]